jgi:hypothetical protein
MTPSEQKIYDAVNDFRAEQSGFNSTLLSEHKQMKETIISHDRSIDGLIAIKDRGIGAVWLSGILGGTGVIAWLYSFFK